MTDKPETLRRYDPFTDEYVPVTQDWLNDINVLMQSFGRAREAARIVVDDCVGVDLAQGSERPVPPRVVGAINRIKAFYDAWEKVNGK